MGSHEQGRGSAEGAVREGAPGVNPGSPDSSLVQFGHGGRAASTSLKAIALLCGTDDYRVSPRVAKPTSGLIEQRRVFGKLRRK